MRFVDEDNYNKYDPHNKVEDIKGIIFSGNKDIIPTIFRSLIGKERIKLINYIIKSDGKLGNIEDYLTDCLYIPKGITGIRIEKVLVKLGKIENLDKFKLLQEIKNNITTLLNSFTIYGSTDIVKFLNTIKEIEKKLPNDSDRTDILIKEINDKISSNFENLLDNYNYDIDLFNTLRKFNIDKSRLKEIQPIILPKLTGINIIKYIQSVKENEGLTVNIDFPWLSRQLLGINREKMQDKIPETMLSNLIEELCMRQNIGIEDLEPAGNGFYNFNVKIGDYILKIGKTRKTNQIPNDKRIIKPLIRQQTNVEGSNNIDNLFIEIQNAVDADWYKGLPKEKIKEELYKIYKELRDKGKVWTDIKPENVGRLLKPNKENLQVEVLNKEGKLEEAELNSNNYAVSFKGDEPDEILQPGELVIIDTDYIFGLDEELRLPNETYFVEFERRYKKERSALKTDDIKEIIEKEVYIQDDMLKMAEILKELREILKNDRGYEK